MKKQLLFFLLLIVSSVAYAQFNKVDVAKCPEQLEIYQVDDRENSTIVYMRLNGISSVIPGMWSAYINEKTVAIGISQRTQPEAIDQLAKNYFMYMLTKRYWSVAKW